MTATIERAGTMDADNKARVLTEATLRAAEILGISNKELAGILGVSPSFVSKLKSRASALDMNSKQAELAAHFVRAFRSLDAIVGGDEATAQSWLRNENTALEAVPIDRLQRIDGLLDVVAYLDQRRAPI
ncbi:MAG: MbcA/ParS/Xre antitoxin family protein [Pseudomonadota bacterium]